MYAAIEGFLAEHLGGRFQEGMPEATGQKLDAITVDPASVTVRDPLGATDAAALPTLPEG